MTLKRKRPRGEHILDTLNFEEEQINFERDAWLRLRGWEYTSNTPGCMWLWRKEINSVVYCLARDTALRFERFAQSLEPKP